MSKVDDVLAWAQAEIGKPYVYGDEGPDTFDCSGLMQYVFGEVGILLPRTAHEQQKATTPVSNPQPGDLVFYGDPATHVGLYIGSGQMISAPHPGATVHITGVGNPTGYGRVTNLGAASLVSATVDTVGNPLSSWTTDNVKGMLLYAVFGLLGAALLWAGAWRATTGSRSQAKTALGIGDSDE
ncbi:MAG TPA: C40 family peptidase [Rugosimonospora sp.]|nr:C40 family peptidase [Rugosimonospora sp.]